MGSRSACCACYSTLTSRPTSRRSTVGPLPTARKQSPSRLCSIDVRGSGASKRPPSSDVCSKPRAIPARACLDRNGRSQRRMHITKESRPSYALCSPRQPGDPVRGRWRGVRLDRRAGHAPCRRPAHDGFGDGALLASRIDRAASAGRGPHRGTRSRRAGAARLSPYQDCGGLEDLRRQCARSLADAELSQQLRGRDRPQRHRWLDRPIGAEESGQVSPR
ncbi:hypothetical protein BH11PSE8_BH11PSE8_34860 [soil metagenome]